METLLHITGGTRRVGLYDLRDLESKELDPIDYNLESLTDLRRFIDNIDALVESGELDLLGHSIIVTGIDPEAIEEISLSAEEEATFTLEPDQIILNNLSLFDPLGVLENAEPGSIFYIRSEEGIGSWDLRVELSQSSTERSVEMGYFDCSGELDSYELLRESYLDYLCDTLLPSRCRIDGVATETDRFDFEPVRIEGALFRIVSDPESGLSTLERLPCPSRVFLDLYEES